MEQGSEEFDEKFARGFAAMLAEVSVVLDERARRLLVGSAARRLGRGGITLIANSTGISIDTVGRGAAELEAGLVADGRVRAKGAGRPVMERSDPLVWPALEQLVDPESRGDPMSALRWTTKSTANLAAQLTGGGHKVSAKTVARILKDHGFSLRGNVKTVEGKQHPDRDGQFRYINAQVATFLDSGEPVISVDTKKKELVGNYKAGGREYQPTGEPVAVDTYDFIGPGGKVAPYGVFDVAGNAGETQELHAACHLIVLPDVVGDRDVDVPLQVRVVGQPATGLRVEVDLLGPGAAAASCPGPDRRAGA